MSTVFIFFRTFTGLHGQLGRLRIAKRHKERACFYRAAVSDPGYGHHSLITSHSSLSPITAALGEAVELDGVFGEGWVLESAPA